ncbi:MAG TPA: polysaccharide biosynthesis C-terminal domain-containing protein [Longimicrobiales bacterium]
MIAQQEATTSAAALPIEPGRAAAAVGTAPAMASFWARSAATAGSRVVLVALGIAASVLTARALGPAGLGALTVMLTLGTLAVQFINLGLPSALSWQVAADRSRLPQLLGASLLWGTGVGTACACGLYLFFQAVPSLSPIASTTLLAAALAWIPLGLLLLLLLGLLLGLDRLSEYNAAPVIQAAVGLAVVLALFRAGRTDVQAFYLASFVPLAATCCALAVWLHHRASRVALPSRALLRQAAGYSLRAWLSLFFSFTVLKFDLLMIARMLGETDAGLYAIAASAGEFVVLPFAALGTVVFPAVAGSAVQWPFVRRVTIKAALALLPALVLAPFLAEPLVVLVFGTAYAAAVPALLWLLPGVYLLGINTVLMHYFAGIGMPRVAVISPALATALNVALNLILLPRLGIAGAAIGSTAAYGAMLLCSLLYIRHRQTP